jgi:hypothetical protein
MKWQKSFSGSRTLVFLTVFLVLVSSNCGALEFSSKLEQFFNSNQAGVRLGAWSNLGDIPNREITNGDVTFKTDIKSASFYFEAYAGLRLSRFAVGELVFGIVNRGEMSRKDNNYNIIDYGSFLIYPIQARMKLYPLSSTSLQFQPYLMAGGGVYYARTNNEISNYNYSEYREKSATNFNYILGGGIDWPIAYKFGLDAQFSYMPIHFSKSLLDIKDFSALTFTVGVKYYFRSTGKK